MIVIVILLLTFLDLWSKLQCIHFSIDSKKLRGKQQSHFRSPNKYFCLNFPYPPVILQPAKEQPSTREATALELRPGLEFWNRAPGSRGREAISQER